MILSVIVPVFNAEQFIARCLESLLCQWPENDSRYEIICVNDGSTDSSAHILSDYQIKYPSRIKLLHQDNLGHSAARNAGMSLAQGEIIAFCDADDYLATGAYYYIYTHFWEEQIDILKFWSVTLDKKMLRKWQESPLSGNIFFEGSGHEAIIKNRISSFLWSTFYRREFIEECGITISPIIIGEDDLFNLELYVRNPKVREIDTCAYYYTTSKTQLTRVRKTKAMRESVSGFLQSFEKYKGYADQYPDLRESLREKINCLLFPFMSRALCARMPKQDFQNLQHYLARNEFIPVRNLGSSGLFINVALQNFVLFRIAGFLYKHIFVRFILPHLSRN